MADKYKVNKDKLGTSEGVWEELVNLVVDELGVAKEEVTPNASFSEDLAADSMDLVELIMALEEQFSTTDRRLEISDEEAENIHTAGDAHLHLCEWLDVAA